MEQSTIIQISPTELANLITCELKKELLRFTGHPNIINLNADDKPHLTRKETANFFDVNLNRINDCNQERNSKTFQSRTKNILQKIRPT